MTMEKQPLPPIDLSAKQIRAARALLAWSQQELAKRASVAASTVADFERGHRTPIPNNAEAIRTALERAGVSFLPGGAVIGPQPLALAASNKSGAPVRWIDATDLGQWAERRDGQATIPTLIAKLVRATHGPSVEIRFPSDEGVQFAGWDGVRAPIKTAAMCQKESPDGKSAHRDRQLPPKPTRISRSVRQRVAKSIRRTRPSFLSRRVTGPRKKNGFTRNVDSSCGETFVPTTPTILCTG